MVDDIRDIQKFYDQSVEQESGRLERHQLEHDVTWRYFEKYLPSRGRILEIGAATGAYTIPLAKKGYNVTAVDLSPNLIAVCKNRVKQEGLEDQVTCLVADARDLSDIPDTTFDVVLMMGPLYHLMLKKDRKKALNEVYVRLKNRGAIFSTFISRYGIWGNIMRVLPHYIERQTDLKSVLNKGKDAEIDYWKGRFRAYFSTVDEIIPFHERIGFKTLILAGVEPAGISDEVYQNLESKRRELWLDLLFSISTEKSIIGASSHLLYIGIKET